MGSGSLTIPGVAPATLIGAPWSDPAEIDLGSFITSALLTDDIREWNSSDVCDGENDGENDGDGCEASDGCDPCELLDCRRRGGSFALSRLTLRGRDDA